jgi:hypothetical protein
LCRRPGEWLAIDSVLFLSVFSPLYVAQELDKQRRVVYMNHVTGEDKVDLYLVCDLEWAEEYGLAIPGGHDASK